MHLILVLHTCIW